MCFKIEFIHVLSKAEFLVSLLVKLSFFNYYYCYYYYYIENSGVEFSQI